MTINPADTSIFIRSLKKTVDRYESIGTFLKKSFLDSKLFRCFELFCGRIKISLEYSFSGRITDISEGSCVSILDSSRVIKWLSGVHKTAVKLIVFFQNGSLITKGLKEAKKELSVLPVKTVSIVVLSAVLVNLFLSVTLNRDVKLFGIVLRLAFLFVSLGGLFSDVTWLELEQTSLLLRKLHGKS